MFCVLLALTQTSPSVKIETAADLHRYCLPRESYKSNADNVFPLPQKQQQQQQQQTDGK